MTDTVHMLDYVFYVGIFSCQHQHLAPPPIVSAIGVGPITSL